MDTLIKRCAATGAHLLGPGAASRTGRERDEKMPLRRTRNAGNAQTKEQLGREMRQSRLVLFIQQFEKEGWAVTAGQRSGFTSSSRPHLCPNNGDFFFTAQERMNELEAKMENMLATVDKVFKVELMKKPPSLQNTLIGDLISGEPSSVINVWMIDQDV